MQLELEFSLCDDSFVPFQGLALDTRDNTAPPSQIPIPNGWLGLGRSTQTPVPETSRQQRYFWAIGGRNAGLRFPHGPLDHQYHPRPVSLVVQERVWAGSIEQRRCPPLTNQPGRDGTNAKPPCRLVLCATAHLRTEGLHLGRHHDGGGVSDGKPAALKKTCAVLCRTLVMTGKSLSRRLLDISHPLSPTTAGSKLKV